MWRNLHADGQRERGHRGRETEHEGASLLGTRSHLVPGNAPFDRLFFLCVCVSTGTVRVYTLVKLKTGHKKHHEYASDPQQRLHKGSLRPTRTLTRRDPCDLAQLRSEILLDHSCQSVTVPHDIRV